MPSSSTRHRTRAPLIAVVAALLVALPNACGDAEIVGPTAATGHWRLVSVDGGSPVNRSAPDADGAIVLIDSVELIFRRYGRLQDIRHLWRQGAFGPPVHYSDTMIVTHTMRNDSVFIARTFAIASQNYVDTGRFDASTMEIMVRNPRSSPPTYWRWVYTRIGETP